MAGHFEGGQSCIDKAEEMIDLPSHPHPLSQDLFKKQPVSILS